MVDVCEAPSDELDGKIVDLLEVVRRVAEAIVPAEAEPLHVALDALDELLRLALGIRVVEAQIARAAEIPRHAEVHTDGHRVANVQVAVRLGGKARLHAPAVLSCGHFLGHDLSNEVAAGLGAVFFGFHGRALSFMRGAKLNLLARGEAGDPLLEQSDAGRIHDVGRQWWHAACVAAIRARNQHGVRWAAKRDDARRRA